MTSVKEVPFDFFAKLDGVDIEVVMTGKFVYVLRVREKCG